MNNKNYIAVSAMCKEKIEDIIEWIEYHKAIGVQYFFLYNNDPYTDIYNSLNKELQSVVSVVDWFLDMDGRQVLAQQHCIAHNKSFRWIAFIDIDEYIVPIRHNNIQNILQEYETYGGLCLHWLLFGSNNLAKKPQSIVYSYTQSCPSHGANEHIKSIVNPKKYTGKHSDPHFIPTYDGNVNVKKEKVADAFGSIRNTDKMPIHDIMRINHYYTKSIEDFQYKKMRAGGNKVNREYTQHHFDTLQSENIYNADIINIYNGIKNGNTN